MARAADIYYKISPFSLAAIVMLNFLLIYLNLVSLQNQGNILLDIAENTEIALENQQLGLNVSTQNNDILHGIEKNTNLTLVNQELILNISNQNNDMLERVLLVQKVSNDTLFNMLRHIANESDVTIRHVANETH